jgi:hypothetical protein
MSNYSYIIRAPLDEIELKSGSHHIDKMEQLSSSLGFAKYLDGGPPEPNYYSYPYIYLKFVAIINGKEYLFISKPMQITKDQFLLKVLPPSKSNILIYANPYNLLEYQFESFNY